MLISVWMDGTIFSSPATCVHESLQVQCIDVIAVSRDNAWPQCTELVVIRARMSDLLWSCNTIELTW